MLIHLQIEETKYCTMFLQTFCCLWPACVEGFFGANCRETCGHCRDVDQCSVINGTCLSGCVAGLNGDLCKYSKYYCLKDQDFSFSSISKTKKMC